MPTLSRRTEDARTDEFLAAIRTSAHTVVDDAVPYAVAAGHAAPAVLEHPGRRVLLVLAALALTLAAVLGTALAGMNAAPTARPAHAVVDLTSDATVDRGGMAGGVR